MHATPALVTPVYAALLALFFVVLSVRTLRLRRRLRIAIGDGNDAVLLRAMRVHSNFAEYVPLGVLLAYFAETSAAPMWWVHGAAASLTAGRVLHAWGVSQPHERFGYRIAGMALTFTCLIGCAAWLLGSRLG